jgi:hypothetical protein
MWGKCSSVSGSRFGVLLGLNGGSILFFKNGVQGCIFLLRPGVEVGAEKKAIWVGGGAERTAQKRGTWVGGGPRAAPGSKKPENRKPSLAAY